MKTSDEKQKPTYEDVTIADVRECKGFEKVSDELAQGIADAIRIYTEIIYNCYLEGRFEEEKAKVLSMNGENKKKAA
jgi:hypothetical protein